MFLRSPLDHNYLKSTLSLEFPHLVLSALCSWLTAPRKTSDSKDWSEHQSRPDLLWRGKILWLSRMWEHYRRFQHTNPDPREWCFTHTQVKEEKIATEGNGAWTSQQSSMYYMSRSRESTFFCPSYICHWVCYASLKMPHSFHRFCYRRIA